MKFVKFVKKLDQLYLEKKRIKEKIEHTYRSHIEHITKSPVYGYIDEERQVLEARGLLQSAQAFIERVFGITPDFISILNELVTLNAQLKHYIDTDDNKSIQDKEGINVRANIGALQDAETLNTYTEMMEHIAEEQRLLMEIKLAIADIMHRKDINEWLGHLRRFDALVDEIKRGLDLFHKLLDRIMKKGLDLFPELEEVGFQILELIESEGPNSNLRNLSYLKEWLEANHPNVRAFSVPPFWIHGEPTEVNFMDGDKWRLVLLQMPEVFWSDGIVVPTLGEAFRNKAILYFFIGYGARAVNVSVVYNGTQALTRANVIKFPKVRWEKYTPYYEDDEDIPNKFDLVCLERGRIDFEALEARRSQKTKVVEIKPTEVSIPPKIPSEPPKPFQEKAPIPASASNQLRLGILYNIAAKCSPQIKVGTCISSEEEMGQIMLAVVQSEKILTKLGLSDTLSRLHLDSVKEVNAFLRLYQNDRGRYADYKLESFFTNVLVIIKTVQSYSINEQGEVFIATIPINFEMLEEVIRKFSVQGVLFENSNVNMIEWLLIDHVIIRAVSILTGLTSRATLADISGLNDTLKKTDNLRIFCGMYFLKPQSYSNSRAGNFAHELREVVNLIRAN